MVQHKRHVFLMWLSVAVCIIFINSVEPINPPLSQTFFLDPAGDVDCGFSYTISDKSRRIINLYFISLYCTSPTHSLCCFCFKMGIYLLSWVCWISFRVSQTRMHPRIFAPVKQFNSAAQGGPVIMWENQVPLNLEMGAGTALYTLSAHNCRRPGAITKLRRLWSESSESKSSFELLQWETGAVYALKRTAVCLFLLYLVVRGAKACDLWVWAGARTLA